MNSQAEHIDCKCAKNQAKVLVEQWHGKSNLMKSPTFKSILNTFNAGLDELKVSNKEAIIYDKHLKR